MWNKVVSIYFISILLGLLTGLAGSLFQIAITEVNRFLSWIKSFSQGDLIMTLSVTVIITVLMVVVAWALVRFIAAEGAGSGVQEIEGTLLHKRPIHWRRLLPVKFFGGVLAISAQMVVGREGPTIQMGGNLGAMLGEWFSMHRNRRDALISAGAAAGLATAFNAPLAGVLFVIEEMRNEFNFNFTNFKMVAICCVMATITGQLIMGSAPAIPMAVFQQPSLHSLWLFFVFGIVMGLAGLIFNICLMKCLAVSDRWSIRQKLIYVVIVAALIGVFTIMYPPVVGGGYDIIEQSLTLFPPVYLLLLWILLRFISTLMSYTTGVPGGIFAPMLALGTLAGLASYNALIWLMPELTIHPGMFAVAGMGALFSAAVRAPITGIILVVEMTQNYSLILPLMVSCLTSTTVVQLAGNEPIYTQLLRRTLKNT
nr:H(+)/Cl(-) exchange transporter ClcA [Legionella birminghamensis]